MRTERHIVCHVINRKNHNAGCYEYVRIFVSLPIPPYTFFFGRIAVFLVWSKRAVVVACVELSERWNESKKCRECNNGAV